MSKIMIVDDEVEITKLMGKILTKEGYDVTIVNNGAEALEKINESIPDLILLDIMMPTMDGFEVCNAIKTNEKTRDLPVLMLTNMWENKKIKDKITECGADGYLEKVARIQKILDTMEMYLNRDKK